MKIVVVVMTMMLMMNVLGVVLVVLMMVVMMRMVMMMMIMMMQLLDLSSIHEHHLSCKRVCMTTCGYASILIQCVCLVFHDNDDDDAALRFLLPDVWPASRMDLSLYLGAPVIVVC